MGVQESVVLMVKGGGYLHPPGSVPGYILLAATSFLHINTHPTLGEGQNGKLYGSGPDPFPPPRNKWERVGYARSLAS